jgi:hypothetical protein
MITINVQAVPPTEILDLALGDEVLLVVGDASCPVTLTHRFALFDTPILSAGRCQVLRGGTLLAFSMRSPQRDADVSAYESYAEYLLAQCSEWDRRQARPSAFDPPIYSVVVPG